MNVLGIFVKHPVPGHVKTRLAKEIGNERAARLYEAFTADIAARFRQTADRRVLCYTPNTFQAQDYFTALATNPLPPRGGRSGRAGKPVSNSLGAMPTPLHGDVAGDMPAQSGGHGTQEKPHPPDYSLWPQPSGTLGERLERFFANAFADGATRVVVIGSDSPTLPLEFVERAFALLDDDDCVLGPAADGGYYLIGQSGRPRPIFADVEWGTPRVFDQTTSLIARCGARFALLPQWYDVDTAGDLESVCRDMAAIRQCGADPGLPRTEQALDAEWRR